MGRLAAILLLASGCYTTAPMQVIIVASSCEEAEEALDAAIELYTDAGVDVVSGGCEVAPAQIGHIELAGDDYDGAYQVPASYGVERRIYVVDSLARDGEYRGGFSLPTPDGCGSHTAVSELGLIAHELGHVLGLDHEDDEGNVMHSHTGDHLSAEQARIAQLMVEWYAYECR
jgi:hypothetical protein